jgi:hypothetical protein
VCIGVSDGSCAWNYEIDGIQVLPSVLPAKDFTTSSPVVC